MVRDEDFAWAQGVWRKDRVEPRPAWWRDEYVSYNTCMLSIEIEGYAHKIGETFVVGSRQFETVAAWSAFVCEKYGIPIERTHHVGHSELSRQKGDPGRDFPWEALLDRVRELSQSGETWNPRRHRTSVSQRSIGVIPTAGQSSQSRFNSLVRCLGNSSFSPPLRGEMPKAEGGVWLGHFR